MGAGGACTLPLHSHADSLTPHAPQISAGGLVSALLGIQQNYEICWIGWPGVVVDPAEQPVLTGAHARAQQPRA